MHSNCKKNLNNTENYVIAIYKMRNTFMKISFKKITDSYHLTKRQIIKMIIVFVKFWHKYLS